MPRRAAKPLASSSGKSATALAFARLADPALGWAYVDMSRYCPKLHDLLPPGQPLIVEGIHALNDLLTRFIPSDQKFKIYISPFAQINIDNNNPINLTDLRLLRRIVRDLQFRNTSPEKTLSMWPSVRRGEYKWIYPFIENANYIYNSELTYEMAVLKRYAMAALLRIPNDSEHYIAANRLIKFLKYFKGIDDYVVPCNSLLREFIGKSVFAH